MNGAESTSEQLALPPQIHHGENWNRFQRAAAVLAGATLALAGCTSGGDPTPPPSDSYTVSAPSPDEIAYAAYDKLPYGPCNYKREDDKGLACEAARTKGKIALVYYDSTPAKQAITIAKRTEDIFSTISEGIFRPSITAIKANSAAQKALDKEVSGNDGCIDALKPATYGAVLADENMNLKGYAWVIGFNGVRDCSKLADGAADTLGHGRHTDIFKQSNLLSKNKRVDLEDTARRTAHEGGHVAGLGHDGTLTCADKKTGLDYDLMGYRGIDKPINLAAFVATTRKKKCDYYEYKKDDFGAVNVMGMSGVYMQIGLGKQPDTLQINPLGNLQPVQLDQLIEPEQRYAKNLTPNKPVKVEMNKQTYAMAKLESPISIKPSAQIDSNTGNADAAPADSIQFDQIVFAPNESPTMNESAVNVELVSHDSIAFNNIIELGTVYSGMVSGNKAVFVDGKRTYTIRFLRDSFKVMLGHRRGK